MNIPDKYKYIYINLYIYNLTSPTKDLTLIAAFN